MGRDRCPSRLVQLLVCTAVAAQGYQAPFLTSADVILYRTDTRATIEAPGERLYVTYPHITGILVAGEPADVLHRRDDWILTNLPAGIHDAEITHAAAQTPPFPVPIAKPLRTSSGITSPHTASMRHSPSEAETALCSTAMWS